LQLTHGSRSGLRFSRLVYSLVSCAFIQHVYSKQCLNAKLDEHPVLMTEAPLNPRTNRDHIAEIFFETMRAPALFFTPPSVLSLYASGRTTGVVLDVGEGVTHAVPVYEGFALQHSVTRSDVAGRDVTRQLQLQLRRAGLCFTTTAEADLAKTMKEEICYMTPTQVADDAAAEKDAKTQYQLPDGQVVTVASERYQAPNVLFDPSLFGSEEPGAADILVNSIMKSDIDLRSKLFSQIVLAGGSTLLPGFGDRMLYEVRSRSPSHTKIRISAPPERLHSAYVGGSILASLATFKSMWVSRAEYEEHGSNILHRREL
jgi:centractin